ncbi:VIT domain-containing protein [Microscilla marina]|uniref:von Willebrand factor, type A n=1 Tax=Microscilla marina ATCC 23134 TaxID=313606 RepID=A1ZFT4_MICM2|nr:VIT domain-containing protein [Microscilla marina]EAY30858.1 von Willebrand factor, type A [Microscilla marina ATCC 23134]
MKTSIQLKNTLLQVQLLALMLLIGFGAQAQKKRPKTLSPYFLVKSKNSKVDQMPLKETKVDVNVAGVIADVTVTQVYKNEGKNTLEAIYVFPGSTQAAVYAMTMTIGERKLIAKIEEKGKARAQYEAAKKQGKTASLLEQHRPNVFQMNVANILPKDLIKVELHYTELLVPTDGVYEFSYPTVVGPRYSDTPAAKATAGEKWVKNPYLKEGSKPNYTFDINTTINAGMPIQQMACTSHKVNVNYQDKSTGVIKLKKSEKFGGNRDYIVRYRLAGSKIQSGLLLYEGENEVASGKEEDNENAEKFFLMMMQPPKAPKNSQIPPREYVFIVDVSGSMHGFPLSVSKRLLKNLIGKLRPKDKFNVMLFESSNQMMSPESMEATQANIQKAFGVIDQQRGGGGTRLLPALKKALAFKQTKDYSRSFVVVTDGYVTVEKEAFDLIRNNLNRANLFAFGIGSSVNRFLIEGMARAGMGEPFIVTHGTEADVKAEKFRNYIQNPVLTNIKIKYDGFQVYDTEPWAVPDVFAERPIIVYGKYKGKPTGKITVTGLSGNKTYSKTIKVSSATQENNQAIRYLWARERIKLHDDYRKYYGANRQKHIKKITELGLKYNLLTQYTSFIAISPEVRNKEGKIVSVKQPLPLPKGVSKHAIGNNRSVNYNTSSGAGYKRAKVYRPRTRHIRKNDVKSSTPPATVHLRGISSINAEDKGLQEVVVTAIPGKHKKDHKPKLPALNRVYHQVQTGETLATIAKKYHTSVAELQLWNNLGKSPSLKTGKKLTIYISKKTYTVKTGDSLKKIARRFGVKTRQIKTWNKLPSKRLKVGQKLLIYGR